jgi:hypothetical protein
MSGKGLAAYEVVVDRPPSTTGKYKNEKPRMRVRLPRIKEFKESQVRAKVLMSHLIKATEGNTLKKTKQWDSLKVVINFGIACSIFGGVISLLLFVFNKGTY